MKKLKTFRNLKFKKHPNGKGLQAKMFFKNGYGVSIIRFKSPIGTGYSSYTNNEKEWELAVMKGNKKKNTLTYETSITNDVIGHLSVRQVTNIMKRVQKL